jgi:D-sedoheptulose 7-phosphate isomerase
LARPGDLFIGISTSGNSENIVNAFISAQNIGCETVGMSGGDGGRMNELCDLNIVISIQYHSAHTGNAYFNWVYIVYRC